MIKSENARLNGWVYITIEGRDLGSWVSTAQEAVAAAVSLPPGYTIDWAGQYQYLVRAGERLSWIIPLTLAIILLLLYLSFRNIVQALMVMVAVPFVITSYSIHYTKLYEPTASCAPSRD